MDIKDVFPNGDLERSLDHARVLEWLQPTAAFEAGEIKDIERCRNQHDGTWRDYKLTERRLLDIMGVSQPSSDSRDERSAFLALPATDLR